MSSINLNNLFEGVKTILGEKEEPSTKVGRVRKCPQCGAAVPASKVVCPECGWEFDDTADNNSAMARYRESLKESHKFFSAESEEDVVSSFNIPKSKNDLMKFTLYFKSKLRGYDRKPKTLFYSLFPMLYNPDKDLYEDDLQMKDMYKARYEECIKKIQQFYGDDPDFMRILADYEKQKAEDEKRIKQRRIFLLSCIVAVAIFLLIAIIASCV